MQRRDSLISKTSLRIPRKNCRTVIAGAALAAIGVLGASTASAAEISPYFQGYSTGTLADALQSSGLTHATLAFAVTRGSCAFDPYITDRMGDARNFKAAGGDLIISMGGADGTYAEIACSDDQMFALMDKLITDSGTRRIDWDVEGQQLNNSDANGRRNRVLLRLKAKYPDLQTSFTLPAWLNGLQANGMAMMRSTLAAGVQVDRVNVMLMTFGADNLRTMVSPSTMAQAVINGYEAAITQLAGLYPSKTRAQVHAMAGMTPMVGVNDDATVFTLADAQTVANYAKARGTGMIGYWSYQRDRAQASTGMGSVNDYSGVVQTQAQFLKIFKSAETPAGAPAPVVSPAPVPSPASETRREPAPVTSTCAVWDASKWYVVGSTVSRLGKNYAAIGANQNSPPEWTPTHWSVTTACGSATAAPAPAPAPAPVCASTAWVMGKWYDAGALVTYSGRVYKAKYANPGYNPTISTYYWASATC
jgi:chitinase